MKLITFAVPCYNSQAYMDHCISTLLACGGAEDIEIILVDDGSTDDTGHIADAYREKYPDIVILGKDFLMGDEDDQVDKVINEINMWNPQAVLSCSRVYDLERFVKRHRKKINTKLWFSLGSCLDIFREGGKKPSWLNRFMEKNNFKKMVSKYNEDMEKM